MGEAARIWTTVGANIAPLKAGLAEAGAATNRFGSTFGRQMAARSAEMERFGKSWTRNISLPLLAGAGLATKMAMDFQRNMALISTSAGASSQDVGVLTKQILALAKSGSSPYGPNELAKALYHLKSLGYDNATAMNTLRVSIRGAMAGNSDLESTTSALGAAIRTNIKGTGDFGKAMATLNAIVGAGNMRMEDLIGALGTGVLPSAKAAGLGLKDVGAALALMVDEGMNADAAATRLRMSFSLLAAPSKQADKALATIGLSGSQLGQMMQGPAGLIGTIQLLKTHLEGLGGGDELKKWATDVDRGKMSIEQFTKLAEKTQQFQTLSRAFGGGRSSAAIELLINNLDVLKQKYAQIGNTTKDFNDKVAQAAHLSATKLAEDKAQIEAAFVTLGTKIAPFVVKLAGGIARLTTWFGNLSNHTQKWLAIAGGALAVGGPLLIFTAKIIKALQTMRGLFIAEAAASTTATATVVTDMEAQTVAIETANAAALSFLGTLGLIAAGAYGLDKLMKWAGKGFSGLPGGSNPNQGNSPVPTNDPATWSADEKAAYAAAHGPATADYYRHHPAAEMKVINAAIPHDAAFQADSPAARKKAAEAKMKEAREKLSKQAQKDFDALMKRVYGSAGYTPPNLPGGGGDGTSKKDKGWQLPQRLQTAQARADAIAAMNPNLQGPTALQIRLAHETKDAAMKAIRSHMLTMQGLADAWAVVQQANETLNQKGVTTGFALSMSLQVRQAKADALAAMNPNAQGPTAMQFAVAKQAKAAAMKAIKSHMLSMEDLIAAWNIVGQANQTLAQKLAGQANGYVKVSTGVVTQGLDISHDAKVLIRERQAQIDAHGGRPVGPAASGQVIHIDNLNLNGIRNIDELYSELEKVRKRRGQRQGQR